MYDPASCTWYLRNSLSTGMADITFGFGSPGGGWLPVVGDWTGVSTAQMAAAGGLPSSATASVLLVQADLQPTVTSSSSLPATAQANSVTSNQTQLPAVNPSAVDQLVGLGDLDTSATSLVLPTSVQSSPTTDEVDAVFAQLS
jgi:hypothetical protein